MSAEPIELPVPPAPTENDTEDARTPLDAIIHEVREDASDTPEQYLDETEVPAGGE
jgi:hypothetical protein